MTDRPPFQPRQAPSNVTPLPSDGRMFARELKRINKGALVGFFELHIPEWGVVLHDCKWFRTNKGEWIGLPSTSFTTREGVKTWKNLVEFPDREAGARFQEAAMAAVRRIAPTA